MAIIGLFLVLVMDLIHAPAVIPSDAGSNVVSAKDGGDRRWSAQWTMDPATRDGRKTIRFTEHGEGRMDPYPGDVRWALESVWDVENGLRPLDSEKTVTTAAGAPVAVERKTFDWRRNSVHFERRTADGRLETRTIEIPPDTLAVEGIAGALRFLPFRPGMSFPAHVLSNEPKVYSVTFEQRGTERVRTPAGEFECYKVEMLPHLGVLNVVRPFLAKAFFWFTAAPPHFWVRYEGPENGPMTTNVIMALDRPAR